MDGIGSNVESLASASEKAVVVFGVRALAFEHAFDCGNARFSAEKRAVPNKLRVFCESGFLRAAVNAVEIEVLHEIEVHARALLQNGVRNAFKTLTFAEGSF